jgi:uncharacterized protein
MKVLRWQALPARGALLLLRGYKAFMSPLLPPSCRYMPTCSEYAMEAVERYGVVRGGWKAIARVLRCHPFVTGGYDPVVRAEQHIHNEPAVSSKGQVPVLKES